MRHWLVKQEPDSYAWGTFEREKGTSWTGVRNYQARNNLRAMCRGDLVFFYHSGENREIVGLARVTREAYSDPTAKEGDWSCVDLEPVKALRRPVSLSRIKSDPLLKTMPLVRNSRLSVSGMSLEQFNRVLELAG
jgi:predicted RNA-binding protein with PUA-like domain